MGKIRASAWFGLPGWDIRRKVGGYPRAETDVRRGPGTLVWDEEARMNARVRKLIEQLGEAIHESVSESEQIAGVVQNIRSQGFDVLLMLEATIGLNEVETQPGEEDDASKPEVVEGGEPFTAQDVSFLRSLRISVEGDEGVESDDVDDEDDLSGPSGA
jgi:hypothetical protein